MSLGRPGFNSLARLFHLSQISKVDISGTIHKIHRYLYIKDICDVIIQYKGHNGNESVHYLQRKIIEENWAKIQENWAYLIIPWEIKPAISSLSKPKTVHLGHVYSPSSRTWNFIVCGCKLQSLQDWSIKSQSQSKKHFWSLINTT